MARKPADQSVSREEIVVAAADVLRRKGYEATTMKDIAAEVNLTAASLYHHFRNKDTLLLAVLEEGLEYIIGQLEPIAFSGQTAAERLSAMMTLHVVALTHNTAVGAAFVFEIKRLMTAKLPPSNGKEAATEYADFVARRDAFFARRDYFEKLFRDVVKQGIADGEFLAADAAIFTKTFLGAHNWVGVWYKEGGRLNGETIAAMMVDTFMRALRV